MGKSHAILSPSGASRWLACTPSARLESSYPSSTNDAADEGTLAHTVSELHLRNHFGLIKKAEFTTELKKAQANKFYNKEMEGHCMDYVNFIVDKHSSMHQPTIIVEDRIDLTAFVPEGFGTLDCALITDAILDINDLKYGKGVLVEAQDNKQLMLYALGAIRKYSLLYHIDMVRMTIFQPRLDNFSSFEIPAQDLIEWGESFVIPRARDAYHGKGEYTPGDHCRFCKARNSCKALADQQMELARFAFEDPNKLSDQDISEILEKAPTFITWINSINEYALQEAVHNGKMWPGFKLVAGRSNRILTDPDAIIKALKKAKKQDALFMKPATLMSIGDLEKNIGKAELDKLIGKWIIKPQGKATLVPEWDKRPALNSAEAAKDAFSNIQNDN